MNEITWTILVIWVLCGGAHVINIGFCIKRWLPMKKGRTPQKSFIKKSNRMVLWIATIISYVAVVLFCIFYDVSIMEKAKLFAIIVMIFPVHPTAIMLIVLYCFLFNQNRKYSSRETE